LCGAPVTGLRNMHPKRFQCFAIPQRQEFIAKPIIEQHIVSALPKAPAKGRCTRHLCRFRQFRCHLSTLPLILLTTSEKRGGRKERCICAVGTKQKARLFSRAFCPQQQEAFASRIFGGTSAIRNTPPLVLHFTAGSEM
jgi:hypothetical protein